MKIEPFSKEFEIWFMGEFKACTDRKEYQAAMIWHSAKAIIWIGWQAGITNQAPYKSNGSEED